MANGLLGAMEHALDAEAFAKGGGFLQSLDPRVKLVGVLALVIAGVAASSLVALALLFGLAVLLAFSSGIGVGRLWRQAWLGVLLFTGLIAVPSVVFVAGDPLFVIPGLGWTATLQGLRSAAFLVGRAETSATFALLLILSTPWPHVLKALRCLGVPVILVALLGMTHRYIFVLLQTAAEIFEARRSRTLGRMGAAERRRIAATSAGMLLGRALDIATEVHLAMISRGYRGEVRLMEDFRIGARDLAALAGLAAAIVCLFWVGR